MRVVDILQNITKAQAALNDLNIGEAKSRLDKAIGEISHPALRFLIVDEAAWLAAFREDLEQNRKAVKKEAEINYHSRIAQLEDQLREVEAELEQKMKE